MGYKNTQVDTLFADARKSGDPDERVEIYAQIYEILTDELPFRPLQHPLYAYGFTDRVHGVEYYEDAVVRTDLIWLDEN
jgi:ABC-type transport system substrate-binding protein